MDQQRRGMMAKENLIDAIVRILKTDRDMDFLLELPTRELEILVASLRELLDRGGK